MPDDKIPDGADDAVDEPRVGATSPVGAPIATPEDTPAPDGTHDDATSVVAASSPGAAAGTAAAAAAAVEDEATSVPGTTDAGPRHAKRKTMSRTWVIATVAAVVILAGAGIALAVTSGHKNKPKALRHRHPVAATVIPAPVAPVCPLTGQPAPGGQIPPRPALAFKVDNYPTARPQSGLTNADIVFEEPVEGGITRLVAVFQCQNANLVGPIRSARAVDVQILSQLSKPLLVHAGGINQVIGLLNSANLTNDDVFTHSSIVQHPSGRYAPYDTYASTAAAWGLDKADTTPPAPVYTYSAAAPTGTPVGAVHIPFSGTNDNTWNWSGFNGAWFLSIGGVPANVADGGTRIGVANIVVQTVHVTYGPWVENGQGGLEVWSQLTGFGPLAVFRNGQEITGTWQRGPLSATTSLVAANGAPIALAPGKTWVELVPSNIPVTTKAPVAGAL